MSTEILFNILAHRLCFRGHYRDYDIEYIQKQLGMHAIRAHHMYYISNVQAVRKMGNNLTHVAFHICIRYQIYSTAYEKKMIRKSGEKA